MRSKSNTPNLETFATSSLVGSVAIHAGLLGACLLFAAIAGRRVPTIERIDLEVYESPHLAAQSLRETPRAAPKLRAKPRQVFGLSRKSITSELPATGSEVSLKAGNTIAKAPDQERLRTDDADSLPIPTEEYLVSKMPVLIGDVRVPYPAEARTKSIQGAVVFDLLIDRQGQVRQSALVAGPGYGMNEAAAEAVKRLRYTAAEVEGKAVAVKIRYAYRFVLEK